MLEWFSRLKKPKVRLPPQMSEGDPDGRKGQRSICIKCGAILTGSFIGCFRCGFTPISEVDLATSLAVSEQYLGQSFLEVAAAIEGGATPQLSSADIEATVMALRTGRFRFKVGIESDEYVRQDMIENNLEMLAPQVLTATIKVGDTLRRLSGIQKCNATVLAALVCNAALRGILSTIDDEAGRAYVRRAFPYRFGKRLSRASFFSDHAEQAANVARHFPEIMTMVAELDEKARGPDGDELLAAAVYEGKPGAIDHYMKHCPAMLTWELAQVEVDLARKEATNNLP